VAAGIGTDSITWWAVVSAFGGTIIGSVLGGFISYWLQKKSLSATKDLHDADRREVRKVLGYSLLFKMIRMCSDFPQLGGPAADAVKKAKDQGHTGWLWPMVLPMAPLPDPIKFSPEEMALVLSLDSKLFNDMAALDDLHKSTVALFALYATKRGELTATLRPDAIVGNKGETRLTAEDRARMGPPSVELDMLIAAMIERTQQDGRAVWESLSRLHDVLEKEFDLKHKFELKKEYEAYYGTADRRLEPAGTQPYYHHYKN